jgi:hypothetical protein
MNPLLLLYQAFSWLMLARTGYSTAPHLFGMALTLASSVYLADKLIKKQKSFLNDFKWITITAILIVFFYCFLNLIFTPIWLGYLALTGYSPEVWNNIINFQQYPTNNVFTYLIGSIICLALFKYIFKFQFHFKWYIPNLCFFIFWLAIGLPTTLPLIHSPNIVVEQVFPTSLFVNSLENLFVIFFSLGFVHGLSNLKLET